MKCTSQAQADEIALIGAAKMAGEGYDVRRNPVNPSAFRVRTPEGRPNRRWYFVEIAGPYAPSCTCAFFSSNRRFKICKHVVFCRAEAEALDYCAQHGLIPGTIPGTVPQGTAGMLPALAA